MPKKIVLITMQLKTPGGIERFISTLATMFSKTHEVEIIVNYGRPEDILAFPLPKNIKLTFLSPTQPKEVSLKTLISTFKWHKIPHELKRRLSINKTKKQVFKKQLNDLQADYIITERAEYNQLVQRFYHGRAIKIATDHNFHQNNSRYIHELISSLRTFNYLIVATKELQIFYQPLLPHLTCLCIPNPLDNIPTKKSQLATKNILAVGRLVYEKDFASLIDVMSIVHQLDKQVRLTIIGDGPDKEKLTNKIKALSLQKNISMPGFLPQSKIQKYYYDSSLFVMTSRTEAFALVLSEAMSYGLPCIAFDRASGARAQINKDTGVLIPGCNKEQMASAIVNLLNTPDALKKYQQHIDKYIQTLDASSVSKSWQQVVQ